MSKGGVLTFLFGFAAFMGIFMSVITLQFRVEVIAKIFFMTVALFGALSVFGHTTNKDLSGVAKIAGAAFLAYVAFMVLGMFFPSIAPTGAFEMIVTAIALVAISVLVAWKTQMLKQLYYGYAGNAGMVEKMAAYGAAMLLLSFINMFQLLLSLFGNE
jgi:FtsH-binding integral membrane protein